MNPLPDPSSTVTGNKAVVRRIYTEVLNQGELDFLAGFFDPALEDHCRYPGVDDGVANIVAGAMLRRTAFPDLVFSLEDLVAEHDLVTARWVMRGTHQGDFMGLPPTGRSVEWRGITQFRLVNGRVVERWLYSDDVDLLRQLGE